MSQDTIDELNTALNELRSYTELLESIKAILASNPGVDLDVSQVKQSVMDFSGTVTDLVYAMQQKTDYKIKIRVES